MSFNLDDPLAGILSDGSDDSFFDDDILGKKKPVKKKATPIAEKKNALFDLGGDEKPKPNTTPIAERRDSLFDLGGPSLATTTVTEDKPSKAEITKSPASIKRTISKESIKFAPEAKNKSVLDKLDDIPLKSPAKPKISASSDKLDILGDLIEPKKPKAPLEKGRSSQSLLDDILGGQSSKTFSRPATAAVKSQEFDLDAIIGKSDAKPTIVPPKTAPQKPSTKSDPVKEAPKKSKSNEDWLGIFESKETEEEDDAGMPAWLVGDKKKKSTDAKRAKEVPAKVDEKIAEEEVKQEPLVTKPGIPPIDRNVEQLPPLPISGMPTVTAMPSVVSMPAMPTVVHGNTENVSAEGAALYLEQQESQLMLALQLKAQEEKLAVMQMRQKESQRIQREAALAQHAQVDAMLQRQVDQRQQMQAIIAAHQERITQRIKDLLGTTNENEDPHVTDDDDHHDHSHTREKREPPHVKEKKQLLQLVQSLQENHDKEIDLMETSYRRQLAFLEVSVNQSEERMKEESDKIVKFYTEKLRWLEEHHRLYKNLNEENLNSLNERHKAEYELLRQQHLENIKVLQEHHVALMENIKNAVKQEQVLIRDSAGFSSDLSELVADVKESKSQCQQLVEKVTALTENTQHEAERSLQARETQINEMLGQLKRERENFETEKAESRDMVKMMETRLKQMTSMIEEEMAALKQKKMEFEFEKATFSKQTEFAKNVLKKQDEEIKMLRDDIQKEYNDKIARIDEEKAKALKDSAAIAKEKASIQNLKQELEKTKAELQAQLEEISEERSKINMEKQQLHLEEQRILAKSRDLDLLAKTAIEKQTQADKKYSEAELIQRRYEERIRRMQEHVVSLNTREKQIAKEKVALSRERLSLHNERKQIESRQHCSLCKNSQNQPAYNFDPTYTYQDTFLNAPIPREFGSVGTNLTMNAIEQEMSHLISRNFNLRHTTGVGSLGREDRSSGDRARNEDHFSATQSLQLESGAFKDYMDPKFMMLRLDVQQVLSNLETKKDEEENSEHQNPKE